MRLFIATLLATALMGNHAAAIAEPNVDASAEPPLGWVIAAQGNVAIAGIRAEMIESLQQRARWVAPAPAPIETLIHVSAEPQPAERRTQPL